MNYEDWCLLYKFIIQGQKHNNDVCFLLGLSFQIQFDENQLNIKKTLVK